MIGYGAGPTYPQRVIIIADWGLSSNSSSTLAHVLDSVASSPSQTFVQYNADFVSSVSAGNAPLEFTMD